MCMLPLTAIWVAFEAMATSKWPQWPVRSNLTQDLKSATQRFLCIRKTFPERRAASTCPPQRSTASRPTAAAASVSPSRPQSTASPPRPRETCPSRRRRRGPGRTAEIRGVMIQSLDLDRKSDIQLLSDSGSGFGSSEKRNHNTYNVRRPHSW